MAGPDPTELRRVVDAFPAPPDDERFERVDELLDGAYGAMVRSWYPELRERAAGYADGNLLREALVVHVESVPSFRLADGAAPLHDRHERLVEAANILEEVTAVAEWYRDLRALVTDDPAELTPLERLLHGIGYALAHVLFLGASTPKQVVRRLRLAYRSVGVSIDDTASAGGTERTTFTCPYRDVGAGRYGTRWVCHEKLDRVDDGYVTYLNERGIDYRRPRACPNAEQCYSTVARDGPEQWWPKTPPTAAELEP
ncbi:hypothetical protein [Halosegnis sp.]|uniref:hypothetical protein n=1 Tax=Halosegnis sp. TaxID=2864959 RepID=UPI0035D3EEBA